MLETLNESEISERLSESDLKQELIYKLQAKLNSYEEWASKLTEVIKLAAAGDFEARVIECPNEHPFFTLASGINHLLDITDAFVRESGASLEHAAHSKFYRKLLVRGLPGCFRDAAVIINSAADVMAQKESMLLQAKEQRLKLAADFETTVQGVISAVAHSAAALKEDAQKLSTTADLASDQVNAVAAATEETSANVRSVAAATEELTSSVGEISRQVDQSTGITSAAVKESDRTSRVIDELNQASTRIGTVVQAISKIAKTTNLLALNATIEAARAGEAGKGFAVVASEVKDLAQQTARATEEITSEIGEIQLKTKESVDAISHITTTIRNVDSISETIASSVGEQRQATNEISSNVHQAADATQEVSRNVSGVSQAVKATSEVAGSLAEAADRLSVDAAKLRTVADCFLTNIRS